MKKIAAFITLFSIAILHAQEWHEHPQYLNTEDIIEQSFAIDESNEKKYIFYIDQSDMGTLKEYNQATNQWDLIESTNNLNPGNDIKSPTILAKGRKDRKVLDKMGIQSIRFSSETFLPTHLPESIKWVLYDNDYNKAMNQGQISAEKICTTFNKINLVIPSHYQCTDIPELAEKLGLTEAKRVLLELIN